MKFLLLCLLPLWATAQQLKLENPIALPKPPANVEELRYSSQGNYLAALLADNLVILYDGEGQMMRQYSAPSKAVWGAIAFSPDEAMLALAQVRQDSTYIHLYDTRRGELLQKIFLFDAPISAMKWHEQAQVLMCASEKRDFVAWRWEDNTLKIAHKTTLEAETLDEVWDISPTENGRFWALAGAGNGIAIYEWKKEDLRLRQSLQVRELVYGAAFHPTEPKIFFSLPKCVKGYQYHKRGWWLVDSLPTFAPVTNQLTMLKGDRGLVCVQEGRLMQYTWQEDAIKQRALWEQNAQILAYAPAPDLTRWAMATADGKLWLFRVREE